VVLAIVRELSTNAHDAHIEAGNANVPFSVKLPTAINPKFVIRDYGTGLSPDSVYNVYTQYFSSTRNGSDEFTGALGLGSKSPFAYSDQFTVVSYYDGQAYTYSMFKAEDGSPSVALLLTTDTDEPNGLEITVPVKASDYYRFSEAARLVYPYFKVAPKLNIAVDLTLPASHIEGNGYAILHGSYHNGNIVKVVMGQVCYQVQCGTIREEVGLHDWVSIMLYANIGECSVAASREELHLDKKTEQWLRKKIEAIAADLRKTMDIEVAKADTALDKCKAMIKYGRNFKNLALTFPELKWSEPDKYTVRKTYTSYRGVFKLQHNDGKFQEYIHDSQELVFIEEDVRITPKYRANLSAFIKNRADKQCFYLAAIQDRKVYEDAFGKPHYKLSELPAAPKVATTSVAKVSVTGRKYFKRIDRDHLGKCWLTVTELPPAGAYCVPRNGNNATGLLNEADVRNIMEVLDIKEVYGVHETQYEAICKKHGYVDLAEYAKPEIAKLLDKVTPFEVAKATASGYMPLEQINFWKSVAKESTTCHNYHAMLSSKIPKCLKGHAKDALEKLGLVIPGAPDYSYELDKRYPMLRHVSPYSYDKNSTAFKEYIRLVEINCEQ
jgi:hypothetical protein